MRWAICLPSSRYSWLSAKSVHQEDHALIHSSATMSGREIIKPITLRLVKRPQLLWHMK